MLDNDYALMFRCPVCEDWLPVKKSKRDSPYIVCNNCGVQMFVRYKEGIDKFFRKCSKRANLRKGGM